MYGKDEPEMLETGFGCGCFQSFWKRSYNNGDHNDQSYLLNETGENLQHNHDHDHQVWVVEKLKKLKEISELIAGPKWKNFLRRIGAYFNSKINKKRRDFGYDSYDYALNFDDGNIRDDENEFDNAGLGFSSRFAPPVSERPKVSYS